MQIQLFFLLVFWIADNAIATESFNSIESMSVSAKLNKYYLISSSSNADDKLDCINRCLASAQCKLAVYIPNELCSVYNYKAASFLVRQNNAMIFERLEQGQIQNLYTLNVAYEPLLGSLQNYWPINGDLVDAVGGANMTNCVNNDLVDDRFGNAAHALSLNSGYCQVPPGVYFAGEDFTFTAWAFDKSQRGWARIIDFGNGAYSDNVVAAFVAKNNVFYFLVFTGNQQAVNCPASTNIANSWHHVVVVFSLSVYKIYINGRESGQVSTRETPANIMRTKNYVGKSNFPNDPLATGFLSEIKIYSRALSASEIIADMNSKIPLINL